MSDSKTSRKPREHEFRMKKPPYTTKSDTKCFNRMRKLFPIQKVRRRRGRSGLPEQKQRAIAHAQAPSELFLASLHCLSRNPPPQHSEPTNSLFVNLLTVYPVSLYLSEI